ncbi:MAG: hypothetical protein WCO57_15220, partial [Verrucomicrobiota bacterium]
MFALRTDAQIFSPETRPQGPSDKRKVARNALLEVPPLPAGGFSDEELLKRLKASSSEAEVTVVAKRLAEYRT